MPRERVYQAYLIKRLRQIFQGAIVLKNDSEYLQGIPDLLILFNDRWAALEVKASRTSPKQPNQVYWIDVMNGMSFAAFIFPENEGEVLDALQRSFAA